jgi:hypothetical protein
MDEQTNQHTHGYKYAVLRYVPDFATDEFMNAGIIMYSLDDNSIRAKLIDTTSRLECFDPDGDHAFFLEIANDVIEYLQDQVAKIKKTGENMYMQEIINKAFSTIARPDSGLISFSDIKGGLADDIDKEFDEIYDEYVGSKIKKKPRGLWGNLAVTKVYEMIDRIKGRLKKMPERRSFNHPFMDGSYKCEVSFNDTDNVNLKVLSLRPVAGTPHRLENIFAALPVLSTLKKQHKKHHFGGLIYFSPKYNRQLQEKEFSSLTETFKKNHLDCVRAEEKEMIKYFSEMKLVKQ